MQGGVLQMSTQEIKFCELYESREETLRVSAWAGLHPHLPCLTYLEILESALKEFFFSISILGN